MPCFPANSDINYIISSFRERFYANKSEEQILTLLDEIVSSSLYNWRTTQYDYFQKMTNGIIP
jgi:hypothetical protein